MNHVQNALCHALYWTCSTAAGLHALPGDELIEKLSSLNIASTSTSGS